MITKIANAIAKAHILHHKAEFNVVAVSDTSYLCTVTHKDRSLMIEEVINTSAKVIEEETKEGKKGKKAGKGKKKGKEKKNG